MQLDELKNTWREEMNAEVTPESFSYNKLVADVKKTDRGALFARNVIVTTTGALIVLCGFIWFLVKPDMNLPQHASMVLMLVLFCYLSSVMTTSLAIGSQDNWTMARRLDIEIENIQNQVSISKSLPGRFVLPMFLVVILGSYGGYYARTGSLMPDVNLLLYLAGGVVLFGGTAWGYLHSEKKKLTPMLNQLIDLRRQLNDVSE